MAGYATIVNTVRTAFATLIATPESLPLLWDNFDMGQPVASEWVRLSFQFDESSQISSTGPTHKFRTSGRATVTIFVPLDLGVDRANEIADLIKVAFRKLSADGIRYDMPRVAASERDDTWWKLYVEIPFLNYDDAAKQTGTADGTVGFEDAARTIRSRFITLVGTPQSVRIQQENRMLDPEPTDEVWINLHVQRGSSGLVDYGTLDFRTPGIAWAMVFAPVGTGDRATWNLIDAINSNFRAVSDTGVTFHTPSPRVLGRTTDGNGAIWWHTNLMVPFTYDEMVTV